MGRWYRYIKQNFFAPNILGLDAAARRASILPDGIAQIDNQGCVTCTVYYVYSIIIIRNDNMKNTPPATACGEYRGTTWKGQRTSLQRLVHGFHCSFIRQNPHVLLHVEKEKNVKKVVTEHRRRHRNEYKNCNNST